MPGDVGMHDRKQLILEAAELRAMLEQSAEEGARKALSGLGLHDKEAADDVRDLRSLLADFRAVKRGVFTSIANAIALGILALIGFGVVWHLKKGP